MSNTSVGMMDIIIQIDDVMLRGSSRLFDEKAKQSALSQLWSRDNRMEANLPALSCDESLELLSKRGLPIPGILCLPIAHHVDHFDPAEDDAGSGKKFETKHSSDQPLDGTVIMRDTIVIGHELARHLHSGF